PPRSSWRSQGASSNRRAGSRGRLRLGPPYSARLPRADTSQLVGQSEIYQREVGNQIALEFDSLGLRVTQMLSVGLNTYLSPSLSVIVFLQFSGPFSLPASEGLRESELWSAV